MPDSDAMEHALGHVILCASCDDCVRLAQTALDTAEVWDDRRPGPSAVQEDDYAPILPPSMAEMARLIAVSGYLAYKNTLVGNRAPVVTAAYERMSNPQPGDLVLETSTYYREPWNPGGLGRLILVGMEPCWTQEEWVEGGSDADAPIPEEKVWYIRPFVSTETGESDVRWTNADFIALPTHSRWLPISLRTKLMSNSDKPPVPSEPSLDPTEMPQPCKPTMNLLVAERPGWQELLSHLFGRKG